MKINKDNYEIFFLDYHEGNLLPEQEKDLLSFLEAHPGLREEFEAFRMVTLEKDEAIQYPAKEQLRKGVVTSSNYETFYAAYVEGDLDEEERTATEAFAQGDPQRGKELNLMKKTLLRPDLSVKFPAKDSLKRQKVVPLARRFYYYAATAAAITLLAGLLLTRDAGNDIPAYVQDFPASGEAEFPKAVADMTSPVQEEVLPAEKIPAQLETTTRQEIVSPLAREQRPLQAHYPQPLSSGRMMTRTARLESPTNAIAMASVEPRNQFAYWSYRQPHEEAVYAETPASGLPEEERPPSLVQLAFNRLQRSVGVDFERVEGQLRETRIDFWEVAGLGLEGLNTLTGNHVTLEKERGEDGRIVQFAIGEGFEISRPKTPAE